MSKVVVRNTLASTTNGIMYRLPVNASNPAPNRAVREIESPERIADGYKGNIHIPAKPNTEAFRASAAGLLTSVVVYCHRIAPI